MLHKAARISRVCDLVSFKMGSKDAQGGHRQYFSVHRDIAARNCLLTSREAGRIVKICDLGMSRCMSKWVDWRARIHSLARSLFVCFAASNIIVKAAARFLPSNGCRQNRFLMAFLIRKPMVIRIFQTSSANLNFTVWAYGVLLWEIFSMGYMPYTYKQNQEVMQLVAAGSRLEKPLGVPENVRLLETANYAQHSNFRTAFQLYAQMLRCWHTEPSARPSFDELVTYFNEIANVSCNYALKDAFAQ